MHCFLRAILCLRESLLSILEAEDSTETPDARVLVVEDVGLRDSVFSRLQLPEAKKTQAQVVPGIGGNLFFTDFEEDDFGIGPGLPLCIDYAESLLEDWVLRRWLDSDGIDVTFFTVEEVIEQVECVASQHPCFLIVWILFQKSVQSLGCLLVLLLQDANLGFRHQVSSSSLVSDEVQGHICDAKDGPFEQKVDELKEE